MLSKSSLITNICFAIDNCFAHQKVSFETSSFCELLAFIFANNRKLFESENINFYFYFEDIKANAAPICPVIQIIELHADSRSSDLISAHFF